MFTLKTYTINNRLHSESLTHTRFTSIHTKYQAKKHAVLCSSCVCVLKKKKRRLACSEHTTNTQTRTGFGMPSVMWPHYTLRHSPHTTAHSKRDKCERCVLLCLRMRAQTHHMLCALAALLCLLLLLLLLMCVFQ